MPALTAYRFLISLLLQRNSGRGKVWGEPLCRYSPFAVRQNSRAPSRQLPATSQKKSPTCPAATNYTSRRPLAKSEWRTAKSVCFQDFACKSHGLKILPGKFFADPMESRFYGVPGGGGTQQTVTSAPVGAPAFMRGKAGVFMKRALAPGLKPAIEVRPLFPRINPRASTRSRRLGAGSSFRSDT